MPARLVLPSTGLLSGADGAPRPQDLQAELRQAAQAALEGRDDGADPEVFEALACTACEVIEGGSGEEAMRIALEEAIADVGLADEAAELVLEALQGVAAREAATAAPILPAKRPLLPSKSSAAGEADQGGPKWQRRGDVERKRMDEYLHERNLLLAAEDEEQKAYQRQLIEYYGGKVVRTDDDEEDAVKAVMATITAAAKPESDSDDSEGESGEDEVTLRDRGMTIRRLRQLGRPVTLFGESDEARLARLRQLEMVTDQDEFASGSTNTMQILDRRAEREAPAVIREATKAAKAAKSAKASAPIRDTVADANGAAPTAAASDDEDEKEDEDEAELEADGGGAAGKQGQPVTLFGESDEARLARLRQPEDADDYDVEKDAKAIAAWLRVTLREWESSLQSQSQQAQNLQAFKTEKAQFRQAKQYLRPLRRSLRDCDLPMGMVKSLASMARHCKKREYKQAKEAYYCLAIGNTAWPIGVTMVTFHDRASRHNIGEGAHAHVLDDETTRKYVQMVKRLCTFCETRWPVDSNDPSLA